MHAYLIIANRNIKQLELLLELLDHENNVIYLTIDAKSEILKEVHRLTREHPKIVLFDNIDIYWGSYSQVAAEMQMIKAAAVHHYEYYHLISGVDLPMQSQKRIHEFFDEHPNKEFLTFAGTIPQNIIQRRKYPRVFRRNFRPQKNGKWVLIHFCQRIWLTMQIAVHLLRKKKTEYVASNWCSIDDYLAQILVQDEKKIETRFFKGYLVDEVFIPWVVEEHNLWSRIYYQKPMYNKESDFQGNLRYINWWDGDVNPKTFRMEDLQELERARKRGYLFARKFDQNVDAQIIEKVAEWANDNE